LKSRGPIIPIVVRELDDGTYEIVDGEHRLQLIEGDVPEEWVEVRDMTDAEVRSYVRSSLTRGVHKDLIKEAEHYHADYLESGLGQNKYAESISMDNGKLSKIFKRINQPLHIKEYISQTKLPAEIVDEVIKTRQKYVLEYLQSADRNSWNVIETRERVETDIGRDGQPVKASPTKRPWKQELNDMEMTDRGAVSFILNDILVDLTTVKMFLEKNGGELLSKHTQDVISSVQSHKDRVSGVRNVVTDDGYVRNNELDNWMLDGDIRDINMRKSAVLRKKQFIMGNKSHE
jgi:hypothetical protein